YPVLRLSYSSWPTDAVWAAEAPLELLGDLAPADRFAADQMDARMTIEAPENTAWGAGLSAERTALTKRAEGQFLQRTRRMETRGSSCQSATPALAQGAGVSLAAYEDFLYGATLLDWDAAAATMARSRDRLDGARDLQIVGRETDLRLSLAG